MALQTFALNGQLDAESFVRYDATKRCCQRAKKLVAFEVPADGAVDVEDGLHFSREPAQFLVRLLAFQLRTGPRRECLHHGEYQRVGWHRLVVEHDKMPDYALLRVDERHAQVTHRAHVNHALVVGKNFREPVRNMTGPALRDFHAGRAGQVILEVLPEIVVLPEGQRASAQVRQTFGHKHPPNVQPVRKVLHEGAKEWSTGHRHGSLNDCAEQFFRTPRLRRIILRHW